MRPMSACPSFVFLTRTIMTLPKCQLRLKAYWDVYATCLSNVAALIARPSHQNLNDIIIYYVSSVLSHRFVIYQDYLFIALVSVIPMTTLIHAVLTMPFRLLLETSRDQC